MALMLDTEVVLTAILANKKYGEGVSYHDIRRYCDIVKEEIFAKTEYRCINFGVSADGLSRCVLEYPRQFSECNGMYYKGYLYKQQLFVHRNSKKVNKILESVAQSM